MTPACKSTIPAALAFVVLVAFSSFVRAEADLFPGTRSDWNGFARYEFLVEQLPVSVVVPERAAAGRPWVWHGEFFGHKPAPDIELLRRGFHIVYVRIPDMLGSPQAVSYWDRVYEELTQKYRLAPKVALVGLSRGGLYCYNWAAANPQKVACIYADAPVCDFKSWPGGKGKSPGSQRDWQLVLEKYGFQSEAEAIAYTNNPVDNLAPLAAAKVPLLHVFGNADEVVPWEENTGLLAERYRELGGSITLIEKPGVGHHPHGLVDSTPIVEFIEKHASVEMPAKYQPRMRDPIDRMAAKIEADRQIVYRTVDDRELCLHVFHPAGWSAADRRSCFLVIHGGGWTNGTPQRMYPFAQHFADRGMVAVSVQYRLLDRKKGTTVFDCVDDARAAIRFAKENASLLGIDPAKIVACGGSAGGHLAAETALYQEKSGQEDTTSSVPAALVLLFPVIDTSAEGYGNQKIGERWKEISPAHQVHGTVPPTILFHGTADTTTPFAGAVAFHKAMQDQGNQCELVVHQGGVHGYLMRNEALYRDTLQKTETFLRGLGLME